MSEHETKADAKPGELSDEHKAVVARLKKAWFMWHEAGKRGTAWDFIDWYEARLRGQR